MRFSLALAAVAILCDGASAAAVATSTTTKFVTKTAVTTSTTTSTKTATVTYKTTLPPSTVTSTATTTVVRYVTQPAQTVTQPAQTVTQPAQTVTQTVTQPAQTVAQSAQTVTQPAQTVTLTSTETDSTTTTQTTTASAQTVTLTSTETDSTTLTQTTTASPTTVTQVSTESDSTTLTQTTTASAATVTVTQSPSTVTLTQSALTVTLPVSFSTITSTVTVGFNTTSAGSSVYTSTIVPTSSSNSSYTSSGVSIISSSSTLKSSSSSAASSNASSSSSVVTSVSTTTSSTPSSVAASVEYTATSAAAVYAAQATALTSSPTSNVQGAAFNRFVVIWLENTDYSLASADPNLQYLASRGITLPGMYGVTHPSEPNYVAAHGGDNFGMNNDNLNFIPSNVSTVFDLLDTKGISWGEYQEGMPYSGFEGKTWINQTTGANNYVRKHNPGVIYNSASQSTQRLSQMKNLSMFYTDLANNQLPQWMFITPNMLNDGHDTSVTVAGAWTRNFLEPLLSNPNFTDNTLVLVTFDENESYTLANNVFTFVVGDAIPASLVGTTDSNFYTHYSQVSTICANWNLPTLGRYDAGANVLANVASATGDTIRNWTATSTLPTLDQMYFNSSYAGPFNSVNFTYVGYPPPNSNAVVNGRSVLPAVVSTWGVQAANTYYGTGVQIYDGMHAPPGY